MAYVLLVLEILVFLFCIGFAYIYVRSSKLFKYRHELLQKVKLESDKDIDARRDWSWRYQVLESVSWDEMVFSLRRFRSFYPDNAFIRPPITIIEGVNFSVREHEDILASRRLRHCRR